MIAYFLIVAISIAGGEFQTVEDVRQPNLAACLNAAAARLEHIESHGVVVDKYKNEKHDEYEVAVTCSLHKAAETPL